MVYLISKLEIAGWGWYFAGWLSAITGAVLSQNIPLIFLYAVTLASFGLGCFMLGVSYAGGSK